MPDLDLTRASFRADVDRERIDTGMQPEAFDYIDGRTSASLDINLRVTGKPASISSLLGDLSEAGGVAIIETLARALGGLSSEPSAVVVSVTPVVDGKPGPPQRFVFREGLPEYQFVTTQYATALDGRVCWINGSVGIGAHVA